MSKLVTEWFNDLKPHHRIEALQNMESINRRRDLEAPDLFGALGSAFDWHATPQGREYWRQISEDIARGTYQKLEIKREDLLFSTSLQHREESYFNEVDQYLFNDGHGTYRVSRVIKSDELWFADISIHFNMAQIKCINCKELEQ